MRYSHFAQSMAGDSGIVALMDDLGRALNLNPDILFLGGGNPASIAEFESIISEELAAIAADAQRLRKLVGVYQSPQGDEAFIDALADYYSREMAWPVSRRNIALCNGSQSAFFILFNMLSGDGPEGKGQICFPLMPEYLGYADQCLSSGAYYGTAPKVALQGAQGFKYHIDFDQLALRPETRAICVSRPNNPSGNVLSDDELERLRQLARRHDIPLLVDCAYGAPFPGICYAPVSSVWQPGTVMIQSLSKLGLPGVRTGIVIADEPLIETFVKINTVMSLAHANLGPTLALPLIQSRRIDTLRDQVLLPFYSEKKRFMLACLEQHFHAIDYRIHAAEGGFFVWLWLPNISISTRELYQRCKQDNVLIMPGEPFFFGLEQPWQHTAQCVRLNYCGSAAVIETGVQVLGDIIRAVSK